MGTENYKALEKATLPKRKRLGFFQTIYFSMEEMGMKCVPRKQGRHWLCPFYFFKPQDILWSERHHLKKEEEV